GPDESRTFWRYQAVAGWAHLASCSRSPFSSVANHTRVACEWRNWLLRSALDQLIGTVVQLTSAILAASLMASYLNAAIGSRQRRLLPPSRKEGRCRHPRLPPP